MPNRWLFLITMAVTTASAFATAFAFSPASAPAGAPAAVPSHGVMMQYFHWYSDESGGHWRELERNARQLAAAGFTALWLPPATKGIGGTGDVGYGLYDLYDLGEFEQKGTVRTKYGTKDEFLSAVSAAQVAGLEIYSDVIFNHLAGGDELERAWAVRVADEDRTRETGPDLEIQSWTRFLFPARGGRYSGFRWSWFHFDGTDWDQAGNERAIFKFRGEHKDWDRDVDHERGNYDYLLFNDTDLEHPDVREEFKRWGRWYTEKAHVDGFRIDAAKHTSFGFTLDWLTEMERANRRTYFAVAEYWTHDLGLMRHYWERLQQKVALFDFPLQDRLAQASRARGFFDMSTLYSGTLVANGPALAVTFVDNHDTQRHLGRAARVEDWFKPLAYALLLLRREGYPCVFYPDYYGPLRAKLDLLMAIRKRYAHGEQHTYIDHPDIIGWTREGVGPAGRAMAVVMSDSFAATGEGVKQMYVGTKRSARAGAPGASRVFKDATGNVGDIVRVGEDGMGSFPVRSAEDGTDGRSLSIWVEE